MKSGKLAGVKLYKETQSHTKQINEIINIKEKKLVFFIVDIYR